MIIWWNLISLDTAPVLATSLTQTPAMLTSICIFWGRLMMDFKNALIRKRFLKKSTLQRQLSLHADHQFIVLLHLWKNSEMRWLNSLCDPVYHFELLQIPGLGIFATEKSGRSKPPGFTLRALSFNPIACFPKQHLFGVNSFVCTSICDSHQQPHVIYPTVKHLLCNALMKASGRRIDKPFLTTAA